MRIEEIRSELCARLRSRHEEIEQAVLARVNAISDPEETREPEYVQGLRAAVAAATSYGIDALERNEDRASPIPTALLSQARLAVRNRVPLDTVLRRYLAGYTVLGDFVIEQAEHSRIGGGPGLKRLLRVQAAALDRLIAAVCEEYGREERRPASREERRAEQIERLLSGAPIDVSELGYDLDAAHLGVIASGPGAEEAIRALATHLDCHLLSVRHNEETLWAWLGTRSIPEPEQLGALLRLPAPRETALAFGEPGEGRRGWRRTHRQAEAALPIAQRRKESAVRYADVALLAATLRDDLLATSLCQLYLRPLVDERDGGAALRQTLRAYLAAGGSLSSAASTQKVSRRTISNRLRKVEEKLGRPLHTAMAEIETALRMEELDASSDTSQIEPVDRS